MGFCGAAEWPRPATGSILRVMRPPRPALPLLISAAVCLALAATPRAGWAQSDPDFRFGLSVGGVSTIGLVFETVYDWGSFELMAGTWSFRDLSVSLVHKQYPGGGRFQGVVGLGVWMVLAFPPDENLGAAIMARAPIGVQWGVTADHFLNLEIGLNRALAVKRTDPDDDTPVNRRLIPLPGAAYRWEAR